MVKGTLEVLLVDGKDIKDKRFDLLECLCLCGLLPYNTNMMLPYVLIQWGNQELMSGVAEQDGKRQIWNEKHILKLDELFGDDKVRNKLVLKLMSKNKTSDDHSIGEAIIYIKDVLSLGEETGKATLGKQKYRVVLPNKTYSGEISVAVSFTLDK